MLRCTQQENNADSLDSSQVRIFVPILQNMKTKVPNQRDFLETVIEDVKLNSSSVLKKMAKNEQEIFDKLHRQYILYKKAYLMVAQNTGLISNIDEFLLSIQGEISITDTGSAYVKNIIQNKNKYNWVSQFRKKWFQTKQQLQKGNQFKPFFAQFNSTLTESIIPQNTPDNAILQPSLPSRNTIKQRNIVIVSKTLDFNDQKRKFEAMTKYLLSRKDYSFNENNSREISFLLVRFMEKFMKNFLQSTVKAALLRNNRNSCISYAGDQFRYFSKDNPHISFQQPKLIKQPIPIRRLTYRNKLELYSQLRIKQSRYEQQLIQNAKSKRENDKRTDKKLWDYFLRHNSADEKTAWIQPEPREQEKLLVDLIHVRYALEGHPLLKNSYVLFSCYNA